MPTQDRSNLLTGMVKVILCFGLLVVLVACGSTTEEPTNPPVPEATLMLAEPESLPARHANQRIRKPGDG